MIKTDDNKVIVFILINRKSKKRTLKELTKIALTSNNLSEYAVMSTLYKMVEAGNRIINDSEKRARVKKIYRR